MATLPPLCPRAAAHGPMRHDRLNGDLYCWPCGARQYQGLMMTQAEAEADRRSTTSRNGGSRLYRIPGGF